MATNNSLIVREMMTDGGFANQSLYPPPKVGCQHSYENSDSM